MEWKLVLAGVAAACLCGLAGCSRSADGTMVPAYRMTVQRVAGVPLLTMQRAPAEEEALPEAQPAVAAFPPPPKAPLAAAAPSVEETRAAAEPRAPARPRPRRTPPTRRAAPVAAAPRPIAQAQPVPQAQPAPTKPMACQSRKSDTRAVSIVCE